eukprot:gene8097-1341_t
MWESYGHWRNPTVMESLSMKGFNAGQELESSVSSARDNIVVSPYNVSQRASDHAEVPSRVLAPHSPPSSPWSLKEIYQCLMTTVSRVYLRLLSCLGVLTGPSVKSHCSMRGKANKEGATELTNSQSSELKGQTTPSIMVDMGYYERKTQHDQGLNVLKLYVQLMQIVPAESASRALIFTWPIETGDRWVQVSPGFFDAPGSHNASLPGIRELYESRGWGSVGGPHRPPISIAFASPAGHKTMAAVSQESSTALMKMFKDCVRETLDACQGYESKDNQGSFLIAFEDNCSAVEWALTLQMSLLQMPWPSNINEMGLQYVRDQHTHEMLFGGMRCQAGILNFPSTNSTNLSSLADAVWSPSVFGQTGCVPSGAEDRPSWQLGNPSYKTHEPTISNVQLRLTLGQIAGGVRE